MDTKTSITLIVSVLLAVVGYGVKYINDLRLAQRKDQLNRVNMQLKELYGPMLALVHAADSAWRAFRSKCRPNMSFWHDKDQPTENEAGAYRLWMTEVFMPLNLKMTSLVIEHSDLLIEDIFPECLHDLNAHVQTYKAVIKAWENDDFSQNTAYINFPRDKLTKYVEVSYTNLKQEQRELLKSLLPGKAKSVIVE